MAQPAAAMTAVHSPGGPADKVDPEVLLEQSNEDISPKAAIAQEDVAFDQLIGQLAQEGKLRNSQTALGNRQDGAAQQAEQHDKTQHRKAGLVGAALNGRISGPIFPGVGQERQSRTV